MARRSPLTLQQLGEHAQSIAWSFIIGSSLAGALVGQELARRWLPRWH